MKLYLTHLHHGSILKRTGPYNRAWSIVGAVTSEFFMEFIENLPFKTIGRQCYFANITFFIREEKSKNYLLKKELFRLKWK